jgi:hypothetical protein
MAKEHTTHSRIEAIWQWCRNLARPQSTLAACGVEGIDRVAHDIGLSGAELYELASRGPESADLLGRRMSALDLNRNEVARAERATFQDLQRVCSMCDCKKRCARDLVRNPDDPIWKDYCSNAQTLTALGALPWAARREW